jgi:hypothetical protein
VFESSYYNKVVASSAVGTSGTSISPRSGAARPVSGVPTIGLEVPLITEEANKTNKVL